MRTGWMVVLMVAACGDDGAVPNDSPMTPIDAAIDAPPCGFTVAPTQPASGATCNPATQTGCAADEKCTWIQGATQGSIGCAPVGPARDGCACTVGAPGATGYDDCGADRVCLEGRCAAICDQEDTAPGCATNESCVPHATLFAVPFAGVPVQASVCARTCNPLTQTIDDALAPACGSSDPSSPTLGCYGYAAYTCADAGPLSSTDRELPATLQGLNGCAPGFIPLFYEATGTTVVRCTGFCAALEVDNTPAHAMNGKGDAAALGKLPTQPQPRIGDATCDIGVKGSHASSTCKFIWPYLVGGGTTANVPRHFATGPYLDTLGVCQAIEFFRYDPSGGPGGSTPIPDCATLPPHSAATPGNDDDAADWGCQKRSNSPVASGRAPDVRLGHVGPVPMLRYRFL